MSLLKTKHKKSSALGRVLLNMLLIALILLQTMGGATADAVQTVADSSTLTMWEKTTGTDTKNIGRIWTDKSVSTEESVTLPGGDAPSVAKGDSDFLVVLSALSSAGTITGETTSVKPLDIVLVLDTSGSMGNSLSSTTTYTYEEVYSNRVGDRGTYYAKVEGADGTEEYVEITNKDFNEWWEWGSDYGYELNGQRVYPKQNSNDTAANHIQFYRRRNTTVSVTKLQALKNAANAFIDSTATKNQTISDNDKKHRISLVTFASEDDPDATKIRYNLTVCNNDNAAEIKRTIDRLSAEGATAADYGMDYAKDVLEGSEAREDAQKVVIFFTDGEPNHYSGFDEDVANTTITTAKSLKDQGTKIYSIGMFSAADPSNETNRFNAYMHGVSSNYPDATSYTRLGERAKDAEGKPTEYYKAAANADELNKIFDEIFTEINTVAPSSPVVNGTNGTENMEAITFHDELGDYMKVDDFKAIVFADVVYTPSDVNKTENVTTYIFDHDVIGGTLYPTGNLENIKITVEHFPNDLAKGDIVTVVIPASLIPLREYVVDTRENHKLMTIDHTYPLRIFYGASLKDGVEASLANPDSALQAYIADNTDTNGFVNFYSNKYYKDGTSNGVYVDFEPNDTNDFYYFQEDELLYTGTAPANPGDAPGDPTIARAPLDKDKIYYYDRLYYRFDSGVPVAEHNWVQIPGNSTLPTQGFVYTNADGQLFIKAGTPRTTSLETHALNKDTTGGNKTGTASYVTAPDWDSLEAPKDVIVKLGNNGKLSFGLPGTLEVTKKVTTTDPAIIAPTDAEFEFTLTLTPAQGGQLQTGYSAQKFDKDNNPGEQFTIANGGKFNLKADQTVRIYGLEAGTRYAVTETTHNGFTTTASGDTGTITTNGTATAEFTNTYTVHDLTVQAEDFGLKGTKTIEGRDFESGDAFKFEIKASGLALTSPLPTNATEEIEPSSGSSAEISFGEFTFTKPGHYRYTISEYLPNGTDASDKFDTVLPGMTYDTTEYRLVLDVTDSNGDGLLEITNLEIAKRVSTDTANWEQLYFAADGAYPEKKDYLSFTNKYSVDEQQISLVGTKVLENKSLADYGANKQFGFKIEPTGSKATDATEWTDDPDQPMPTPNTGSQHGKYVYVNSTTGVISIPGITFGHDHIGREYRYKISELQPLDKVTGDHLDGAVKNADGKWVYKGITLDNSTKEVIIRVGSTINANNDVVIQATVEGNNFTFTNTYQAQTDYALTGTKKMANRQFKSGDSFTFKVEPQNGAPAPEKTEVTISPESGAEAAVNFGKIHFTQDHVKNETMNTDGSRTKIFVYKIYEVEGAIAGIEYAKDPKMVQIAVTDDGEGHLTATATLDSAALEWENKYTSSAAFSGIEISKTLTGRSMQAREFTFTITPEGDTPAVGDTDAQFFNGYKASGVEDVMTKLSSLEFTQADAGNTFTYLVDETEPADDDVAKDGIQSKGVTYDQSQYRVELKPTDKGDSTMSVEAKFYRVMTSDGTAVDEALQPDEKIAFNNTYAANGGTLSGRANLMVIKDLTGRENDAWLDTDSFTFKLELTTKPASYQEGDVILPPATVTIDKDDKANGYKDNFGDITFNKVGKYVFKVSEDETDLAAKGITCKTGPRTVTIVVTDPGTGTLVAEKAATSDALFFINEYSADVTGFAGLNVEKTLPQARGWKDTDSFSFVLEGNDDLTVQAIQTGDVELPNPNEITILGTDASKTKAFGRIIFNEAGSYSFKVTEEQGQIAGIGYDTAPKVVNIVVADNHAGGLVAKVKAADGTLLDSVTVTVANTYTSGKADPVVLRAFKILNNATLQDGQFTFVVKNSQGTVVAEGKNDAKGNVVFAPLMFEKIGTYSFTVSEVNGGQPHIQYDKTEYALTITISDDGSGKQKATVSYAGNTNPAYTPVFVNTYDPSGAEDVKPPQTGDNSHVTLWIALLCVSCAGILGAAVYSRRKKQQG